MSNECGCERDLSPAEEMTTRQKLLKLYNDLEALADREPELTTNDVDIYFWHGERRLLTLHRFLGFDEIVPTMRLLACVKGIPIAEITLSCGKGGDKCE